MHAPENAPALLVTPTDSRPTRAYTNPEAYGETIEYTFSDGSVCEVTESHDHDGDPAGDIQTVRVLSLCGVQGAVEPPDYNRYPFSRRVIPMGLFSAALLAQLTGKDNR